MNVLARLAVLVALVAHGPAAASVRAQNVLYTSGSETVRGYLSFPAKAGRRPAIIVVHGDHGLNDWTKEQARRLASRGYVVLAVDLYRGTVAQDSEDAHELMRGLPDDRALRDLEAAFTYLSARPDVRKNRIGAIGWNMGGWYVLQLAIHEPTLAACAVNDSALPTEPADIARIRTPVLGNFGADDRGIPASALRAFASALQAAGDSADLEAYPDTGENFDDPSDTDRYRPEAAADAWARTIAFFASALHP